MNIAATSVISKNYLAFARVLAGSLARWCPEIPLIVLLADEAEGYFDPALERFQVLPAAGLAIPDFQSFCFRHSHRDLLSAIKPYLLEHLFEKGFHSVVYLDADILVLDDLAPLLRTVAGHALTLTPHISEPLAGDGAIPEELKFLRAGIFNGGFLGVTDHGSTRRFLKWWQTRVARECVNAPEKGLLWDQRWLDFAPSFVEDTEVVRDPCYNVAYWNLDQRKVCFRSDAVHVNGQRCAFFHFSGFDPRKPDRITAYWPADLVSAAPSGVQFFSHYVSLLQAAGSQDSLHWPYAYSHFDNGVPIPDAARQIYRAQPDTARFGDPFQAAAPHSFFAWMNSPVDGQTDSRKAVTRLWKIVYDQRLDVQAACPDLLGAGRERFLSWIHDYGCREHGIPTALSPSRPQYRLRFTGHCSEEEFQKRCAGQDFWYHSFYFDNGFQQRGDYNIGLDIGDYGFPKDLTGISVLDVGTGSGWFAAYFEQLGAEVTTVDVRGYCDFDLVGRFEYPDIHTEKPSPDRILETGEAIYYSPVSKGFWIMKEILGLKARYLNARVYDVDKLLKGRKFDLVFAGAVLMHLRDPIGALMSLRAVCGNRLIANSLLSGREPDVPLMERLEGQRTSWWMPNRRCLTGWFHAAGFSRVDASRFVRVTTDTPFIDDRHSIASNQILALIDAYV